MSRGLSTRAHQPGTSMPWPAALLGGGVPRPICARPASGSMNTTRATRASDLNMDPPFTTAPVLIIAPGHSALNMLGSRAVLPRKLGLWSAVGVVVGITIGSGIFRTPASIARLVPDPRAIVALWIAGGFLSLCGALSFAELGAMLPETGGFYAWLREGWGRPVAFTFGWSELVLIRASSLGGMAIAFGEYALRSVGVDPEMHVLGARLLAAALIAFAAVVNIRGATLGAG